jgi:GDSL-like Lipase/Acylhydrolase
MMMMTLAGAEYRGSIDFARDGSRKTSCVNWPASMTDPTTGVSADHNFCRTPNMYAAFQANGWRKIVDPAGNDVRGPWCYTSDDLSTFAYCDTCFPAACCKPNSNGDKCAPKEDGAFTPVAVTDQVGAFALAGDSISVGINAVRAAAPDGSLKCVNEFYEQRDASWATPSEKAIFDVDVNARGRNVNSYVEQLEAASGKNIISFNAGRSGALMSDFAFPQAGLIAERLDLPQWCPNAVGGKREVRVFLGNNDVCYGTAQDKFEEHLRDGLDLLYKKKHVKIVLHAPVRATSLCNAFVAEAVEQLPSWETCVFYPPLQRNLKCVELWLGAGICSNVINACAAAQYDGGAAMANVYNNNKGFVMILHKVADELNDSDEIGEGTEIVVDDEAFYTRFGAPDPVDNNRGLSCCDCFHPTAALQQEIADVAFGTASGTPRNCKASQEQGSIGESGKCCNADHPLCQYIPPPAGIQTVTVAIAGAIGLLAIAGGGVMYQRRRQKRRRASDINVHAQATVSDDATDETASV